MKTAYQIRDEQRKAAEDLPTETKKIFWEAMLKGKNVGEAREIASIKDIHIAAELVLICHKTIHLPMNLEEIK